MGAGNGRRSGRIGLFVVLGVVGLLLFLVYNSITSSVVVVTRAPTTTPAADVLTPLEQQLHALNESLYDKSNVQNELRMRGMLETHMQHSIGERFPLGPIPLILTTTGDQCLVGKACQEAKLSPSRWSPDMHVRDIVISLMLECALPWGPYVNEACVAHDVGANIGLIAHTMATMKAHVVAVEPQVDLCVALRTTLELKGEARKHVVLCGGVGKMPNTRMQTTTNLYRYNGKVPPSMAEAYPRTVPIYDVKQLVGSVTKLKFAKIDTDSHDCLILEQYLDLVEKGALKVESLILETWDWSCLGGHIGVLLHRAQELGYFVYRTLTPRDFDENGWDTRNGYKAVAEAPPNATEQFHQRVIRHMWKMHPRKKEAWVSMVQRKDQANRIYFITTAVIFEQGYVSA
jgi:FkbM family methyltransferase